MEDAYKNSLTRVKMHKTVAMLLSNLSELGMRVRHSTLWTKTDLKI